VFGLDAADGSREWVFDRGLPTLSLRGNSPPVAGHGLVYIGYDDGSVIALRETDGLRAWEQRVAEPDGRTELDRVADIDGELQVGADELFAASFHRQVMAMAVSNGRPLWTRDIGSANGVALTGDKVIVSDIDGNVWALERATGNAVWKQDGLLRRQLTTPVVHGDYVVVGDLEGYLHWLRLSTGEIAGRAQLEDAALRGTPQVSPEGVLYALSTEGELAAYQLGN
jgi:outer membrane protein assembly factor BamB